jgi:hydrogenase nickel incorporation protein HypB
LIFFLFENIGNLVCPASYDPREQVRVILFSVTEGEDKPLKYPFIYNSADLAVITKTDLADAVEFDYAAAQRNIEMVRPGLEILRVSAKRGDQMESLADWFLRIAKG